MLIIVNKGIAINVQRTFSDKLTIDTNKDSCFLMSVTVNKHTFPIVFSKSYLFAR